MKDQKQSLKDTLRHIGLRTVAAALCIFLITVTMTAYIGNRFYAMEKTVLQQRGELNAKEAAMEYDECLLTRVNIVTVVGYAVDQMLHSGRENRAIEKYLTEETSYIGASLDPSTTGLYGWINGEYLDGAGWVPDADYVAVERPWYTETRSSGEKITFVEPYLDMQTDTIMMTVSTLLSDGESVVAMDVSRDQIQRIVEELSSDAEGSEAFVLDSSGIVVAHSDKTQLGKNYLREPDSLGGAIARRILEDGQRQFDLETAEGNCSVYVDQLRGGWYSVSLINSDIWYRPLQNILISFYVILALVVVLLVFVFLRMAAKNLALEQLHTRVSEEEQRGDALQVLSETDRMTGLFDHVSGKSKVEESLRSGTGGMLLELDIDHFKEINDTCGHQTGDLVIVAVADAMRKTFRSNDILVRLGGDEFGAYAVGIPNRGMGERLIHRLFEHLGETEIPELGDKKISVSVGAVLTAGDGEESFDSLYSKVDNAMYVSKKTPGNCLTFAE